MCSTLDCHSRARSNLTSAIITLSVGPSQRLFAAHEDVLCHSPYFAHLCRQQYFETSTKRIDLPDEEPEVFSSVLEYMYKGDYYPKLEYDKKRGTWQLEDAAGRGNTNAESTVYHNRVGGVVLKDTAIYVSAAPSALSLPFTAVAAPLASVVRYLGSARMSRLLTPSPVPVHSREVQSP